MLLALNKPYGMLSQFTPDREGQVTLAACGFPPAVYPLGRLDLDSEGLLLLSDEAGLNTRLLDPEHGHERTYHAQVEGSVTDEAMERLRKGGLSIQGHLTRPCRVRRIGPNHPDRDPPIRYRAAIPTSWLELTLTEGKNRQVRRMTAAVGFPTLRLMRMAIGALDLASLALGPGEWRELTASERRLVLPGPNAEPPKRARLRPRPPSRPFRDRRSRRG
jgi:23S rRNA pseudouridine2457 synthase